MTSLHPDANQGFTVSQLIVLFKYFKNNFPLEFTEQQKEFQATARKFAREEIIPVELFQILKDGAMKGLHSICQQIWKTQQWPQDWKRSVFIPIPKKGKRTLQLQHNNTHLTG